MAANILMPSLWFPRPPTLLITFLLLPTATDLLNTQSFPVHVHGYYSVYSLEEFKILSFIELKAFAQKPLLEKIASKHLSFFLQLSKAECELMIAGQEAAALNGDLTHITPRLY